MRGKVVSWFADKAFGFIQADNGTDIFVHVNGLIGIDELSRGDLVSFDVGIGGDGRERASRVHRLEAGNTEAKQ